jgi:hypothetical protein
MLLKPTFLKRDSSYYISNNWVLESNTYWLYTCLQIYVNKTNNFRIFSNLCGLRFMTLGPVAAEENASKFVKIIFTKLWFKTFP